MSFFRRFERNDAGKDYVVGDIHGCFDKLRAALASVHFNESVDRLFSVGDLVDRGPSSHEAIDWIVLPWFHAVRGNHEQMAIEADMGIADPGMHCINGGLWFYGLSDRERADTARVFCTLPYGIEVDTPWGLVGIVHAEVPGDDWDGFREMLLAADAGKPENFEHMERFALWGRDIVRRRSPFAGVANVQRVYVGHTPMNDWQPIANVHYIDTGAVYGRELTLACLTDGYVVELAA